MGQWGSGRGVGHEAEEHVLKKKKWNFAFYGIVSKGQCGSRKRALWQTWPGVPTPYQLSSSSLGTEIKLTPGQVIAQSNGDTSQAPLQLDVAM